MATQSKVRSSRCVVGVLLGTAVLGLAGAPQRAEAGQGRRGGGAALACRTGIATYRIVTTSPAFTSTIDGSCTFDPSAVEGTCTNLYSDTTGQRFTSVSVTRHATRGDVVDEVSVNPPLNLALGTTTTVTGPRMNSTGTSTLTRDGRRLTGITATSRPGGQTSRTTYSAWDAAGRPTAGTVVAGRDATAQSFTYDDAARTQTVTASGQTCTQTFDENGNPALGRCGGGTATTTVLTTQQVCR